MKRQADLDLLRMICASLVLMNHVNNFLKFRLNVSINENLEENIFIRIMASQGHVSVVVFFVLSGFYVGGNLKNQKLSRNKLKIYSINRFSRIFTVLIPCLLFTFFLNKVTCSIDANQPYCIGNQQLVGVSLSPENSSSLRTFLGNIFLLQGMKAKVFGGNSPLWSISYEFWFYVIFPLILILLQKNLKLYRLSALLIIVGIVSLVNFTFHWYIWFVLWIFGALANSKKQKTKKYKNISRFRVPIFLLIMSFSSAISILCCNSRVNTLNDSIVGFAVAIILYLSTGKNNDTVKSSMKFKEFSFSLYAFHFPIIPFLLSFITLLKIHTPDSFSLYYYLEFIILAAIIVALCKVLSLYSEEYHLQFRKVLLRIGNLE